MSHPAPRTPAGGAAIEVPSRRFGRYLVRSRLGKGGQAEVFLAEAVDERGQQVRVALKLMRPEASEEKFADEADLTSLLSHPNLVSMLEHGVAFGRPYLALEFLLGGDLTQVQAGYRRAMKAFPLTLGLHVCVEVLKGLSYFHQATTRTGLALNLVHGDVNPANIFFGGDGEVKLGDFGVASSTQLDLGPPEGVAAGKLTYLSPEQTRGERLTPASDIWALGVMLYELVVGYHPFARRGERGRGDGGHPQPEADVPSVCREAAAGPHQGRAHRRPAVALPVGGGVRRTAVRLPARLRAGADVGAGEGATGGRARHHRLTWR